MPGPARLGEELGAEADQAARGDQELEPHPAGAVVDHVLHPALAQRQHLGHDAEEVLGHVDRQALDRLVQRAVDLARHDLRLARRSARSPRAASPRRAPRAGARRGPGPPRCRAARSRAPGSRRCRPAPAASRSSTMRAVSLVPDWPASGERVDPDRHAERGLLDGDHRQRARVVRVGDRLADRDLRDARQGDDLAGAGRVRGDARQSLGHVQLGDADLLDGAVAPAPGDLLAAADLAVVHAAEREPADVAVGVQVGDARLERMPVVVGGRGDALDQELEQRSQVLALDALRQSRPSRPWRWCRRSGTRSATRRRRGRGTARRPRRRPRRCARRAGRPC